MVIMRFQRVTLLASLIAFAHLPKDAVGFSSLNPLSAQRLARPAIFSKTAICESNKESSETSASAKAVELKRKAEEAKRKAQELKKVAEAKAAAAMIAVKKANDKRSNASGNGKSEKNEYTAVPEQKFEKNTKNEAEIAAKEVIEKEREKMSAKADVVKQARNKAASRVIPNEAAIIPINEATIEFTAGILAGFLALAVGTGPVLAVASAAAANYISKKDEFGELNELVQGMSKASLSTFNWLAKLDTKYLILGKISDSLDETINKLKNSGGDSAETVEKLERAVAQTTKQLQKLAEETDFLEGSKQALGAVGDIIETGVDKAANVNKEYKLTERATEAAKSAAKNALEKTKNIE